MSDDLTSRLKSLIYERFDGSQRELARAIGVSGSAVNAWTAGTSRPGADAITAICEVTGVTSDWLLFGIKPDSEKALSPYREIEQFILERGRSLKADETRFLRSMRFSAKKITPALLDSLLASYRLSS